MNGASGLEKNALGLTESTIMGVAGTAPVFSIAATSATLIAAVGMLSVSRQPAVLRVDHVRRDVCLYVSEPSGYQCRGFLCLAQQGL